MNLSSKNVKSGGKFRRGAMGAAASLIALSQGQQAFENMRYGEISSAMVNGSIAAGAGYLGWGMLTGNANFAKKMTGAANYMRGYGAKNPGNAVGDIASWGAKFLQKSLS